MNRLLYQTQYEGWACPFLPETGRGNSHALSPTVHPPLYLVMCTCNPCATRCPRHNAWHFVDAQEMAALLVYFIGA